MPSLEKGNGNVLPSLFLDRLDGGQANAPYFSLSMLWNAIGDIQFILIFFSFTTSSEIEK